MPVFVGVQSGRMKTFLAASPSTSRGGRRSYSPEQIQQHLDAYRRSGHSVAQFARQEALSYYTLLSWLQRAGPLPRSQAPRPDFQTMPLSSLLGPAWAAEVVGPSGLTVRLSAQVPPALVTQLIALVCRPC